MTPESPADEVVIIEEQVRAEPARSAGPLGLARFRIAGLVLGGLAFGLVAAAIGIRRATSLPKMRGRRRGALVRIQPRLLVFAPTLTISWPFSSIVGWVPPGRTRPARRGPFPGPFPGRRRAMERRARAWQREGGPMWRRRSAPRRPNG